MFTTKSSSCFSKTTRTIPLVGKLSAAMALLVGSHMAHAACTYTIDNEWGNGYVATITVKNDTSAAVNNWAVNWQYSRDRLTGSWNATISGNGNYQASNVSWNGNLAPGQSASFGFQVNKSGSSAERPQLAGSLCGSATPPSSVPPSSIPPSSAPPTSSATPLPQPVPSSSSQPISLPSSLGPSSVATSSTPAAQHACASRTEAAFQMLPARIPATIQAEDFDPAGYSDGSTGNEGGAYRSDTNVDIKSISGGYAVGWMTAGEWMEYTVFVEADGEYDLTIRAGAAGTGRTLKVTQCNDTLLESFSVPNVADWGQFETRSAGKIRLKAGLQKIRVTVGATDYVDLDWIHIGPYSGSTTPTDPTPPTTPTNPPANGATPSAGCGVNRTLQDGRINLNVNGTNRAYILRVPSNYNNQNPYRLVIGYHWLGGNATQVANGGNGGSTEAPFYGLWDLAQNSTIFVAPEGLDAGWANSGGRDLAFTDAILNQVQSNLCIDKSRIFATGFSYGAGMSNAVACARANVFRGVALYAGATLSGCDGGRDPIAFFAAHGISDSVLNISQGRQIRDRYVANNGCRTQNPLEPARGSGTHICTSYEGCRSGYPVRWCAFDGDHNPTEKDRGQSRSWVPDEAWNFIKQF